MKLRKSLCAFILAVSVLSTAACGGYSQTEEISDITNGAPNQSVSASEELTAENVSASDTAEGIEGTESNYNTTDTETYPSTENTEDADSERTAAETEKETVPSSASTVSETEAVISDTTVSSTAAETAAPESSAVTSETTAASVAAPAETASETVTTVVTSAEASAADATSASENPPVNTGMRNMTTAQIVKEMGLGINLGNTLESCGDWINKNGGVTAYETAWGSPVITEDMIKGYAACGFGVLRIPVAWSNLMGDNYTINGDYMKRVKQIADWTVNSGMYAIVNIHYDSGWWEKFPTEKDECMRKYTRIWEQISDAFKDYGDKLMFESLNEEGGWDSVWNRYSGSVNGKAESFGLLNEINQRFVDTVRASGGNNALRHLLIAGYNTDIGLTCDSAFSMPNDSANHCAVSVHYYTPATFCILEEDASWGKAKADWGSGADVSELQGYMDMLKSTFVDKGIPVIIGEYGVATGNKQPEAIRLFLSSVAREAYKRDMCPVLWDITNVFYDRQKCGFIDSVLLERIMEAKN